MFDCLCFLFFTNYSIRIRQITVMPPGIMRLAVVGVQRVVVVQPARIRREPVQHGRHPAGLAVHQPADTGENEVRYYNIMRYTRMPCTEP